MGFNYAEHKRRMIAQGKDVRTFAELSADAEAGDQEAKKKIDYYQREWIAVFKSIACTVEAIKALC